MSHYKLSKMLHCSFLNVFLQFSSFYNVVMVYDFCFPSARIGHRHTCVPSFPNPPTSQLSSRSSQSTGSGCPASKHQTSTLAMFDIWQYMFQCYCFKSHHPIFFFPIVFPWYNFSVHIFDPDLTFSLHSFPTLL